MECIIATVDHIKFDIEVALDEQYGALPLPFPGMDSKFLKFHHNFIFSVKICCRIHRGSLSVLHLAPRLPKRALMPISARQRG